MSIEPQKEIDSVKAKTGLGKELEENCRRFTENSNKLACLQATKHTIGFMIDGLDGDTTRKAFQAINDIENAEEEIKQETDRNPERIPTPEIGDVTVYEKR